MAGKYVVTTLGCKVNQYESQVLREVLEAAGWRCAEPNEAPDLAVINTCAVTARASAKNRQAIRRESRNGQTHVVVAGCGASADSQYLRNVPGVMAVFGHDTDTRGELRKLLTQCFSHLENNSKGIAAFTDADTHPSPDANDQKEKSMRPTLRTIKSASTRHANQPLLIITPESPIVNEGGPESVRIDRFEGHQRAFLKIQDGCDAHCTYCIIPQLRPHLRSKPLGVAVAEATQLVRAGHREIILTGIFLGAYGQKTAIRRRFHRNDTGEISTGGTGGKKIGGNGVGSDNDRTYGSGASGGNSRDCHSGIGTSSRVNDNRYGDSLAELVQALVGVPRLERLRLSSLEPGDVTDSLLDVLSSHKNCVPHLHLPLQSGSADILRNMNRQYTRDEFIKMIERVRSALDRPAITTDIIVGFPGETDADFEQSLKIARFACFAQIHAFPFSPRARTAAVRWQNRFIPHEVVRDRMNRLRQVEQECSLAFRRQFLGHSERILVEQRVDQPSFNQQQQHDQSRQSASNEPEQLLIGRSDRYFEIHVFTSQAKQIEIGELIPVQITAIKPDRTIARHLKSGVREDGVLEVGVQVKGKELNHDYATVPVRTGL